MKCARECVGASISIVYYNIVCNIDNNQLGPKPQADNKDIEQERVREVMLLAEWEMECELMNVTCCLASLYCNRCFIVGAFDHPEYDDHKI